MDAFVPWRLGPDCPDWDAVAVARALRPARPRIRGWRHAWTALVSAALVGGLTLLAEDRSPPTDEILALTFVPETGGIAPWPEAAPVFQTGRFDVDREPFVRIGEASDGRLFLEAVRVAAEADGLAVIRGGLPAEIATRLGPADTLAVTLEDRAGTTRACTAFRLAGPPAVSGLHCAGAASCPPSDRAPEILAVLAAALAACPAPAIAELGGNQPPSRASLPQSRRDRATKAADRPLRPARPKS